MTVPSPTRNRFDSLLDELEGIRASSSISTRVVDRLCRGFDFRVGEGDDGDGAGRLPIGSP